MTNDSGSFRPIPAFRNLGRVRRDFPTTPGSCQLPTSSKPALRHAAKVTKWRKWKEPCFFHFAWEFDIDSRVRARARVTRTRVTSPHKSLYLDYGNRPQFQLLRR